MEPKVAAPSFKEERVEVPHCTGGRETKGKELSCIPNSFPSGRMHSFSQLNANAERQTAKNRVLRVVRVVVFKAFIESV